MRLKFMKVLGNFYWYPEKDFDIHNHLRVSNIPQIDDIHDCFQLMGEETLNPPAPHLSPWEVILIEKYQDDKCLMFIKFNHCLGDGIALQYFISHTSTVPPNIIQKFQKRSIKREILSYLCAPVLLLQQ
jgi:hypothetical protein